MTKIYACLIEGKKGKVLYAIENSKEDLTERIGGVLGCNFSPVHVFYGNGRKVETFQYGEKENMLPSDMSQDLGKLINADSVSLVLGKKALAKLLQIQQMKNTLER